jgi:LPXTG-site transpeptidase (sortase) family protein
MDGKGGKGGILTALLVIAALVGVALLIPGGKETTSDFRPLSSPAKPIRLVVPSLGIRATVLPIEVNARNVLDPPGDVKEVGWWRRSVRPGADHGQTVLTGHTVHTGGGVMNRLGSLKQGKVVRVVTPKGTMVYRTTKVLTLTKAQLAKRSTELFGQTRASNRLVLVTCTGWTGKDYTSNIVVFATPLGVRKGTDKTVSAAG